MDVSEDHTVKNPKKSKTKKSKTVDAPQTDTNKLFEIKKKLVKVQYPGLVKNVDKALETLGGINALELATADPKNKLELSFHPKNKFNKPCTAERDTSPGILIKVTEKESSNGEKEYEYEVIGASVINFSFTRAVDFQYLPLVAKTSETPETEVEYIYNKIVMDEIPSVERFLSPEATEQKLFLTPSVYSKFEYANQSKLYLNANEKFEHHIRPEVASTVLNLNKRRKNSIGAQKQISIFADLHIKNPKIPEKPYDYTVKLMKEKNLDEDYKTVKALFDKRPCWTKVAIAYTSKVSQEHLKFILPVVAYFCSIGPWRMSWIRFGYNPQKDSSSRIYQTLDYRIRAAEGTKLKVNAKRSYSSKGVFHFFSQTNLSKVSVKDKTSLIKKDYLEERSFILRPTVIPPARQMFYHYCDILIPEIQGMLSRLPKVHSEADYDLKNGWLPYNFTEQCREIVNNNVLNLVQEQLLEDNKKMKEQTAKMKKLTTKNITPSYCSEMLSHIKKGLYKTVKIVDPTQPSTSRVEPEEENVIDTIDLLNDDDDLEQVNADEVIAKTIPAHLDDNSDEEHLSQVSELDIDMEAVEEVNKMITAMRTVKTEHNADVTAITAFLKKEL